MPVFSLSEGKNKFMESFPMNLKINYIIRRINGTFSYSPIGSDHIFVLRHHVPWLLHMCNEVLLAFAFLRVFFFFFFPPPRAVSSWSRWMGVSVEGFKAQAVRSGSRTLQA